MKKTRIAGAMTLAAAFTALAVLPASSGAGVAYPKGPGCEPNNNKPFIGEGRIDIKITDSPTCTGANTVLGVLNSKRESCENSRPVQLLFRISRGNFILVDSTTSHEGAFQLNLKRSDNGHFDLRVPKRGDCNERVEHLQS